MIPITGSSLLATTPSLARQRAFLTLLADDDPSISNAIAAQLILGGEATLRWLREHRLDADPTLRKAVRAFLLKQSREKADLTFLNFCQSRAEYFDLEEAVWLFVLTHNPEACIAAYQAQLDDWAEEARSGVEESASGSGVVAAINQVLFINQGFRGNGEDYYNELNSYLDSVIDLRRGLPISLSCVYLFVGRRLGLPLVGIGMPGHFLCRYQTAQEELLIDPFHGGRIVSRGEALLRLIQFSLNDLDVHLQPITPKRCLQRLIANLHLLYKKHGNIAEATRLQHYLLLLSR
jgi:regulator of sirC expression with transglutaminase-like and TPR domain